MIHSHAIYLQNEAGLMDFNLYIDFSRLRNVKGSINPALFVNKL